MRNQHTLYVEAIFNCTNLRGCVGFCLPYSILFPTTIYTSMAKGEGHDFSLLRALFRLLFRVRVEGDVQHFERQNC